MLTKNQKAKDYTIIIFNTISNKLLLKNSFLIVYIKLEKPSLSKPVLLNIAIIILALSKLDRYNRLLLF